MASPQKENGYTPIAHEILEALAQFVITPNLRSILDVIFRKTYGWNKKEDKISLGQFSQTTGIRTSHVCRYIKQGISLHLIISENGKYHVNKDYDKWVLPKRVLLPKQVLPKRVINTTQTGNQVLPKQVDTKESKEKRHMSLANDKSMKTYNEKNFSDSEDIVLDKDTGEEIKEIRSPIWKGGVGAVVLLDWAVKRRERGFNSRVTQFRAMKAMKENGYTPNQIKDRWIELENDKFWQDKLDFSTVAKSFDKKPL